MDIIEVSKNHQFNLENLKKYLQENLKITNPTEINYSIKQFVHGQSNPSFLINYNGKNMVLRKKPHGKLLPGAHQIDREYKILCALQKVNFPVPNPILFCSDENVIGTQFYLMDYLEGRIFRHVRLAEYSPEERFEIYTEFFRVMSLLHSLNPSEIGLNDYGKHDGYYQRQISTWTKQYKSSETQKINEVEQLIEWLPKNIPIDNKRVSIVHGDFRLENIIFHSTENKIIAVLDWELSTLGNSMADLAYACVPYHTPTTLMGLGTFDKGLYGIPSEIEAKNLYAQFSKTKIPEDKDWFFYLSFAIFRLSSIAQGVYKRSLQGNNSSPYANIFLERTIMAAKIGYNLSLKTKIVSQEEKIQKLKNEGLGGIFKFLNGKFSDKFFNLYLQLESFMDREIYPNEKYVAKMMMTKSYEDYEKRKEILKEKAKKEGLWNLFLPDVSGLTNLEYAVLCQIMGRSFYLAPEVFNCSAPDTGNMEVLHKYGNQAQKDKYLKPLLEGEIRSCFAMTEKGVPSSDATNIQTSVIKDSNGNYVINGRKWWASGAGDPKCKIIILMGKTENKSKSTHQQQSMILIPMNTPGVKLNRFMHVYGYDDAPHGHMDITFTNVKVPKENLILGEGRGFEIAQGRLGPGRIHHCMRLIGMAERALENALDRVGQRKVFGKLLMKNDSVIKILADCKIEIEKARLLVLFAADKIDQQGAKNSKDEIAMIKIVVPNVALKVIDAASQLHGAEGMSQDTYLAYAYAAARTLRIADGPDEVHLDSLGKSLINKFYPKY